MSAISHFALLILSPEKRENLSNVLITSVADFSFLRKKVVRSAYAEYKNVWLKNCRSSMSRFTLIKEKTTSKAKLKKYAKIGSPCLVLLSNLNYGVVFYHH